MARYTFKQDGKKYTVEEDTSSASDRFATWSLKAMGNIVIHIFKIAFHFWQITLAAFAGVLTVLSFNNRDYTNCLFFAVVAVGVIALYIYQLTHRKR